MTSSSNRIDHSSQRFRNLAFLTVLIVYLLILAGGIVRSTGSGMGCPDWPKCFGRWVPPTDVSQLPANYQQIYGAKLKGEVEFNAVKTWIEYANRLLGVFSGFLVFATLLTSLPYLRGDKTIFWGSVAALLLIGLNGWLGSRVVATELSQYMITLHLLLAILVVFSLLFVLIRSNAARLKEFVTGRSYKTLNQIVTVTIVLSLIQVLLGTQVRDALDEVIRRLGYEQRTIWIENLDWRFYVHRSFSMVVLASHLAIIYQLRKMPKSKLLTNLNTGMVALVIIEILTGITMAYLAVPAAAQPVHLVLAVLLIGLQFVIWLLVNPAISMPKSVGYQSRVLEV